MVLLVGFVTANMIRKIITRCLERKFVPMKKHERFKYERFWIDHWFPFKRLVASCWQDEIKRKHPDIGRWPDA